jgi:RNA polymerase sigma-70 factor (ECF subfamily)
MAPSNGLTTRRSLLEALRVSSNDKAWREFLDLYQPLISMWCHRLGMHQDAIEDLCAEIVGKLVVAMREFVLDPRYRFRGWLKTVVTHAVYDYWRERAREPKTLPLDHPEARQALETVQAPPGIEALASALEDSLLEGLRIAEQVRHQVNPKAWQAFWLTEISGERGRDVAEKLSMTVAAVYTARSRVARLLKNEGARGNTEDCGRHAEGAHP